jgi:hypothetical protein
VQSAGPVVPGQITTATLCRREQALPDRDFLVERLPLILVGVAAVLAP